MTLKGTYQNYIEFKGFIVKFLPKNIQCLYEEPEWWNESNDIKIADLSTKTIEFLEINCNIEWVKIKTKQNDK